MSAAVHFIQRMLLVVVVAVMVAGGLNVAAPHHAGAAPEADEWQFFDLMNQRRAAVGLGALRMSPGLADIAEEWSVAMMSSGTLRHRPDLASQVSGRVTNDWTSLGENVGVGYDVVGLDNAFYASAPHRANVLNGTYNYVGIGARRGGDGKLWVTFNFMASSPVATVAKPTDSDALRGPAVVDPSGLPVHAFQRRADGSIWGKSATSGWFPLGGVTTSSPDASTWGGDRIDVVVRGTDGAVWHRYHANGVWHAWESLGGHIVGAPAAVSWGPGRFDIFAVGVDQALWHRWWQNGSWSDWERLGGILTSAPDATSWGPGRIDVVARGSDNAVWQLYWNGSAWSGWGSLGGLVTSAPAAAGSGGRLDITARGTDGAVYTRRWAGSSWTGWQGLGGRALGDVDVAAGDSGVTVAVTGDDGRVWLRTRDSSGWRDWTPLG